MKSWFQRISFRNKLLFTNLSLLFLALIAIFILYVNSVSSAMDFNMSYIHQFNEQVNMTLDMALETKAAPNLLHFVDNDVKIMLRKNRENDTTAGKYEFEQKMTRYLKMMALSRTNTLRCTIITHNGNVYSSYENDMQDSIQNMKKIAKQLTWKKRMDPYYMPLHAEKINGSSQLLVTAVYQMYDIGSPEGFAYLYLDMDFSEIVQTLNTRSSIPENITSLAIISGEEVIYNSRDACINLSSELEPEERIALISKVKTNVNAAKPDSRVTINGIPCIATVKQNESTGWYILQYMPRNSLVLYSMRNVVGGAVLLVVLILAALILSVMLSNYVSRPIRELSEIMSKAKVGKVKQYEGKHVIWQDEIGKLIQSYNDMGVRINDSINRIYIYQINQKQTELKMLQMQINPHFLYNVLHMISSIAKLEGVEIISGITESLAEMFRYSIKGSEFVTLEDELKQVENYIHIQSMRFPERYQITYEIEDNTRSVIVLKFILQPIVENAIEHGFAGSRANNKLRIKAWMPSEDRLFVTIEDNGIGMEKERIADMNIKLQQVRANIRLNDAEDGIGLTNVNARLKNQYGETYGIEITYADAAAGSGSKGTCVMLKIKPNWVAKGQEAENESNCGRR